MDFPYNTPKDVKPISDYLISCNTPQTVSIKPPKRSTAQNSTLHDNIALLADYAGYTPHQMKLIMKQGITNSEELVMVEDLTTKTGVMVKEYKSSKDLNTKEFTILLEYVFRM